jgi:hypothetical protein
MMTFLAVRSRIFVIFAVEKDGMSARNIIKDKNKINTTFFPILLQTATFEMQRYLLF